MAQRYWSPLTAYQWDHLTADEWDTLLWEPSLSEGVTLIVAAML